jgi:hypothetical protein
VVVLQSIWPDFHQGSVHGAASGPAVQPENGALSVCDVAVLEMPKEEVTVCFGIYFDMTVYYLDLVKRVR